MRLLRFLTHLPLLHVALILASSGCDSGAPPQVREEGPGAFELTCAEGSTAVGVDCVPNAELVDRVVAFNSVGYHPDRVKRATLRVEADSFRIVDEGGEIAFEGVPEGPSEDTSTGSAEPVWIADFTALVTPGSYRLELDGLDPDYEGQLTFRISEDIFDDAFELAMLGIVGQRCGTAVRIEHDGQRFAHGACHEQDGYLDYADPDGSGHVFRDGTGGWHDAGDYGKYSLNAAFAVGTMLAAWEHFPGRLERASLDYQVPDAEDGMPPFLAEARWELEWLLRMMREDGAVYHKLTALGFEGVVAPTGDGSVRYFVSPSSAATASTVAALAQAARIFTPYDADFAARCLDAAVAGYDYLTAHSERLGPDDGAFTTGGYGDNTDWDNRFWAAAEIWETTGSAEALAELEANASSGGVRINFDWADVSNLGVYTYLLSERDGRSSDEVRTLTTALTTRAAEQVANSRSQPYGLSYAGTPYWGINGVVARSVMNLRVAYRLEPRAEYLDAAIQQVDYLFGRNVLGRSFVTGIGAHPPKYPHHRPSQADSTEVPWPGLLVGGPAAEHGSANWNDYVDESGAYWNNEIAINWNAALIYALAPDYGDP